MGAFGKHARDLNAGRVGAHRGPGPGALGAVAVVESGWRPASQRHRARADGGGRRHHARRRRGGARAARLTIRPYPSSLESRHGYAKEFLRQQFRDRFGGDKPPDWEVHTTLHAGDCRTPQNSPVAEGLARLGVRRTAGRTGRAGSGDRQRAGRRRRTRLPPVAVQPCRPQPAAAWFGVQAVCVRGGARPGAVAGQRVDAAWRGMAPQGKEEWTPRNVSIARRGSR